MSIPIIYLIPFQEEGLPEVTAYMRYLEVDSKMQYRTINKEEFIKMAEVEQDSLLLRKLAQDLFLFAYFEKEINNIDTLELPTIVTPKVWSVSLDFYTSSGRNTSGACSTFEICLSAFVNGSWNPLPQFRATALAQMNVCYNQNINVCGGYGYGFGWGPPVPAHGGILIGTSGTYSSPLLFLVDELKLGLDQRHWLIGHPSLSNELYIYLRNSSHPNAIQIASKHLRAMMEKPAYKEFVDGHALTGQHNVVWWEDEVWLQNPNNFDLDIDGTENERIGLTLQEIALIKDHPIEAGIIKSNIKTAQIYTGSFYGNPYSVNDKGDAFRHAFFHAINVADWFSEEAVIRQFADAHESEVPIELALEKEMDLFNNNVGITYGANVGGFTSHTYIAAAIVNKVQNGELKYLTPTNWSLSPAHDANSDGIRDCSWCTNGIITTGNNPTQIKFTNQ